MNEKMITEAEANDLILAIAAQRDGHANGEAKALAALSAAHRRIAALEAEIAQSAHAKKSANK